MDYNIEFAHVYADKKFGEEQEKSINILKKTIKKLSGLNKSFVTCILLDEYSPKNKTLKDKEYIKEVLKNNVPVDFLAHESQLTKIADFVIKEISKSSLVKRKFGKREVLLLSDKNGEVGLKDNSGKYTCALLIAAWTLFRLGIIIHDKLIIPRTNKGFYADRLITILPKNYKESESKVIRILNSTRFKYLVKKQHYIFS